MVSPTLTNEVCLCSLVRFSNHYFCWSIGEPVLPPLQPARFSNWLEVVWRTWSLPAVQQSDLATKYQFCLFCSISLSLSLRIVDNCRSVFLTWMMRLCKIWWQRKAKDIQGFCGNPRNPVGSLSRVADTGREGEKKISGFSVGASSKSAICLRMRMHIENKHIE